MSEKESKTETSSGKTSSKISEDTVKSVGAITSAAGNISGEILKRRNEELKRRMLHEQQLRNAQLKGRLAGTDTLSRGSAAANEQLVANLPSIGRR